ncbi:MAG: XAC2610-related protein [Bacteroidota bacterium]
MKMLILFITLFCIISCQSDGVENDTDTTSNDSRSENKVGDNSEYDVPPTNCFFNQLSEQFNFKLNVNYITPDSATIYVTPISKNSNQIDDSIFIESEYVWLPPMYGECFDIRSFSTGFNSDKEVMDNCPGIFIVADFNFDKKDDFAVAVDNGGNGGYIYAFYLQTKNGAFKIDKFLTEEVLRFPVSFDSKSQTILTSVHANAYQNCETVYKISRGNWKVISRKLIE